MLNRPQAHGCFLRVAPEGQLLSSKPQQGASAALDQPFGATATAADQAATKVKSPQGLRLPNASESQILCELALIKGVADQIHLDLKMSGIYRVGALGFAGAIARQLAEILRRRRVEEMESTLINGGLVVSRLLGTSNLSDDYRRQQIT